MKLTWNEWHVFLLGFFSGVTGNKLIEQSPVLKPMVEGEAWYYGFGKFLFIQYIIILTYILIRSIL